MIVSILNSILSYFLPISSTMILFLIVFLMQYYIEFDEITQYTNYVFIAATIFYFLSSFKLYGDVIKKLLGGAHDFDHIKLKLLKFFIATVPYFLFLTSYLLLDKDLTIFDIKDRKEREELKIVGRNIFIAAFILMSLQPIVLYIFYYLPFKNRYDKRRRGIV